MECTLFKLTAVPPVNHCLPAACFTGGSRVYAYFTVSMELFYFFSNSSNSPLPATGLARALQGVLLFSKEPSELKKPFRQACRGNIQPPAGRNPASLHPSCLPARLKRNRRSSGEQLGSALSHPWAARKQLALERTCKGHHVHQFTCTGEGGEHAVTFGAPLGAT